MGTKSDPVSADVEGGRLRKRGRCHLHRCMWVRKEREGDYLRAWDNCVKRTSSTPQPAAGRSRDHGGGMEPWLTGGWGEARSEAARPQARQAVGRSREDGGVGAMVDAWFPQKSGPGRAQAWQRRSIGPPGPELHDCI